MASFLNPIGAGRTSVTAHQEHARRVNNGIERIRCALDLDLSAPISVGQEKWLRRANPRI
jgi:hypothetical protein